jgi:predicted transcriptional regulator of viral defense system
MKREQYEIIKQIFDDGHGYARTGEITKHNVNRFYISELVKNNQILRIKQGLYKWNSLTGENEYEILDVCKGVPGGVICLTSALSFYELTTCNPYYYSIAIERTAKITLPEFPPIKLFYFSRPYFESGITEESIDGQAIRIYELEKTICDCIKYRNKIGIDIVKEAITEYLKLKNKDLNKIMKYAKICRVENTINKYFEVLL